MSATDGFGRPAGSGVVVMPMSSLCLHGRSVPRYPHRGRTPRRNLRGPLPMYHDERRPSLASAPRTGIIRLLLFGPGDAAMIPRLPEDLPEPALADEAPTLPPSAPPSTAEVFPLRPPAPDAATVGWARPAE